MFSIIYMLDQVFGTSGYLKFQWIHIQINSELGNHHIPYVYISHVLPVFQLGRLARKLLQSQLPMLIHESTHKGYQCGTIRTFSLKDTEYVISVMQVEVSTMQVSCQ